MKRFTKITWLFMAVTLFALPACGGGGVAANPTVDTAPLFTQVASTALTLQTQVAQAVPPAASIPLASPTPLVSPTLEPTNTPLITDTPCLPARQRLHRLSYIPPRAVVLRPP